MSEASARPLFVAYLNTLNRLKISDPANLISRKAAKKNPIHYVAFDRTYGEWLSNNFKQAFGKEIIPHILNCSSIPLCIGEAVKFDKEFADEQERQEEYAAVLDTYNQVQDQGDGIKSFTGILLYLMLDYYCTFLFDEAESFLHPPQANIMGRIIGKTLRENQQAFISTHSEEMIKGLLDVCPERVKIVRITREEDVNEFSVLENEKFNEVWNDPLLKLVPDIDVMNDEKVFKEIVEAFGVEWASIQKDYNTVVSNLHSPKEEIKRNDAKTSINGVLDSSANQVLGIYMVPVGELECFVKEVGGHGPEWANTVLETYPDLDNEVYDEIKKFVKQFSS